MDEQCFSDHCEGVIVTRDINYPNIKKGLEFTRKFIIENDLILIGGMSIDLALKAKNKTGIYRDDKLPDYDFVSPDTIKHSSQLGKYICKKGLPNISVITAMHTTTRAVRVDFVSVADIGYCPQDVFDKLPFIKIRDMKIIHPHFQMMDIHHSLSFPFENPTRPVVSHRWKRDMKRYDLLFDAYPIKKSDTPTPKMIQYKVEKAVLDGSCITGWAALSYWKDKSIKVPEGEPIHILSDNFERLVKLCDEKPIYIESRFGKTPRSVRVTINGIPYEIFDNLGEQVSAEKIGDMHVANMQHIMMIFLVKKYLDVDVPDNIRNYYNTGYVESFSMVVESTTPGIMPSINVYGKHSWSEAYVINRRSFAAKINGIKLTQQDRPDCSYPAAPVCKSNVKFDYNNSSYFNISGRVTTPFIPKTIEFFGQTDIVTMSIKKEGGVEHSTIVSDENADMSAELAEYKLTNDIQSMIVSKLVNLSRRNRTEIANILERWILTSANTPKNSGWANVYRPSTINDTANIKMMSELIEKRIMKKDCARKIMLTIIKLVNDRIGSVPVDDDLKMVCDKTEIRYGDQYNVLNVTNRLLQLIEHGGCKNTLRVSMRYDTVLSKGQQWGIPQRHVDHLYSTWDVRNEAFASPINSRLFGKKDGRFCSLFPDIDSCFGSIGSFFDVDLDRSGNWVVNPPFIESIMNDSAKVVLAHLACNKSQTFFFIIPAWKDSLTYKSLHESKYNRAELELLGGTYFFEDPSGKKMWTKASSIYFALSNDDVVNFTPALGHMLTLRKNNNNIVNGNKSFIVTKNIKRDN
jgi:hypothetical protein